MIVIDYLSATWKDPQCISVTDSTRQLIKEKEKITQQEANSVGHLFKTKW